MKVFNKLVRDKIPTIINQNGDSCVTRTLNTKEFKIAALKKIVEESHEVLGAAGSRAELIKELADLKEITEAVMKVYGISPSEVSKVKSKRKKERGGFDKRIFLLKTSTK